MLSVQIIARFLFHVNAPHTSYYKRGSTCLENFFPVRTTDEIRMNLPKKIRKKFPSRGTPRRERLFVQVVNELTKEIKAGVYPVGARLPTEYELSVRFKASRHTIREALRQLREARLVSARQGSGTRIERTEPLSSYVHSVASLAELMQYATTTHLAIGKWVAIRADAVLARRLQCSPGRKWYRTEGFRFTESNDLPICWTEAYVHEAYSKIRRQGVGRSGPIYSWIEYLYGERIVEVKQTLRAVSIRPDIAVGLKAKANTPALEIERIYKGANDRVIEIAFSIHPVDRFSYSMTLHRDREEAKKRVSSGFPSRVGKIPKHVAR